MFKSRRLADLFNEIRSIGPLVFGLPHLVDDVFVRFRAALYSLRVTNFILHETIINPTTYLNTKHNK